MTHTRDLLPWPENPLERLVLVELQVRRAKQSVALETLGAHFPHATAAELEQVLQMLILLGHVARDGESYRSLRA